jgi:hypothetical protein
MFHTDLTGSMFNLDIPGMEQSKQGNRSVQGSSSYASANSQLQNNFSGTSQQQVASSDSLSTLDNASLGASQRLGSSSDTHSTPVKSVKQMAIFFKFLTTL